LRFFYGLLSGQDARHGESTVGEFLSVSKFSTKGQEAILRISLTDFYGSWTELRGIPTIFLPAGLRQPVVFSIAVLFRHRLFFLRQHRIYPSIA
jgi:hypothetical protein